MNLFTKISTFILTLLLLTAFFLSACTHRPMAQKSIDSLSGGWAVNVLAQQSITSLPEKPQKVIQDRQAYRGYYAYLNDSNQTILIVFSGQEDGYQYNTTLIHVEPMESQEGLDEAGARVVVNEILEEASAGKTGDKALSYAVIQFNQPIHRFDVQNQDNVPFYPMD